jgi:hypothetical protein
VRRLVFAITFVLMTVVSARAQSAPPLPGRLEVAFGTVWIGSANFGSVDANETTGSGGDFRLFSSSTDLASVAGLDGHVSVRVTRSFEAEAFASYTKPDLEVRISSDAETSNAPLTVSDTIREFMIGGAALWYLPAPRLGSRARLFVRGGVAYLRDLENDGTLIVSGRAYEAGGGVKLMFASRDSGWWKGIGARLDARAVLRQKGVAPDDSTRTSLAVGASILVRF